MENLSIWHISVADSNRTESLTNSLDNVLEYIEHRSEELNKETK